MLFRSVIKDGRRTANAVRVNYGHAGRVFVKYLEQDGNIEYMEALYDTNYRRCLATDTTEKQAMAAAAIITADMLATEWIFADENSLTIEEISEFLKTQASVSASERGYEFMCDWVSQHANKLGGYSKDTDVYGSFGVGSEEGWVYIIRSVWNKVCGENGYSAKALLSHLKSKELLQTREGSKAYTKCKRINKVATECVVMKLKQNDTE